MIGVTTRTISSSDFGPGSGAASGAVTAFALFCLFEFFFGFRKGKFLIIQPPLIEPQIIAATEAGAAPQKTTRF